MRNIRWQWHRGWLLLGIWALCIPALAQTLTEKDNNSIKFQAAKKLDALHELMVLLASESLDESDVDSVIQKSYLPGTNQLFLNGSVQIEDDTDPNHTKADSTLDDNPVQTYLHNLYVNYTKTTLDNPIVFSASSFFPVQQTGSSFYIKGVFTSVFKNRHKVYKNTPYKPTQRVIEMRVEKVNTKWTLYITRVGFLRPGEGMAPVIKAKPVAAAAFVRPTPPASLSISGPEVLYRQPDDNYTATLKFNRVWLQVVQTGSAELPVGFYQRRGDMYVFDSLINITLENNSNRFIYHKGLNFKSFERVQKTIPAAPPVTVRPPVNKEDSIRIAREIAARTPKPLKPAVDTAAQVAVAKPVVKPKADTKPAAPKPAAPLVNLVPKPRTDTAKVVAFQAPPIKAPEKDVAVPMSPAKMPDAAKETKVPNDGLPSQSLETLSERGKKESAKKEKEKPIVAVPTSKTLAPGLANALSADARQQKARYRMLGWLQVVAGVAGLAGSYVAYSSINKDYQAYTAKLTKLNAEYDIWQTLVKQPAGARTEPLSLTGYGSPGIYGAYAGGGISLGLVVNGVRTLMKAGKIKPKK